MQSNESLVSPTATSQEAATSPSDSHATPDAGRPFVWASLLRLDQAAPDTPASHGLFPVPVVPCTSVKRGVDWSDLQEAPKTAEEGWSSAIQVWEGKVVQLNRNEGTIDVTLSDRNERIPPHSAKISLEWVTEQDQGLAIPGSVFYLTLYKDISKRSIRNSQELRFKRFTPWSRKQLEDAQRDALGLLARIGVKQQLAE